MQETLCNGHLMLRSLSQEEEEKGWYVYVCVCVYVRAYEVNKYITIYVGTLCNLFCVVPKRGGGSSFSLTAKNRARLQRMCRCYAGQTYRWSHDGLSDTCTQGLGHLLLASSCMQAPLCCYNCARRGRAGAV